MRVKNTVEEISYESTKNFFKKRAEKYKDDNPYAVTMYQDDNKELVEKRNKAEVDRILPLLELNESSRVLDVGCGIGRWAEQIPKNICEYCGVDFSNELIQIARQRNSMRQFFFYQ